ncbi:hypothetical protein NY08_4877 [Rhodococcus sp. B7740]|nr:hypothetical protein NY08_4877 [Rhodococcus sp. B7740]
MRDLSSNEKNTDISTDEASGIFLELFVRRGPNVSAMALIIAS